VAAVGARFLLSRDIYYVFHYLLDPKVRRKRLSLT
jgi:hypothetical protein